MQILPWIRHSQNNASSDNFLIKVFANRGIDSEQKLGALEEETRIYDPMLLKDMDKAVMRIYRALDQNESILIYGDYDCDGVTSTVMLYEYFENEGANIMYYIPNRENEGYGLNMSAVKMIVDNGVNLVITVDNGISSIEEIASLQKQGVDVIVTDHHTPKAELPECVAVINPHRSDSEYPFRKLCGVGVAFKLITALEQNFEEPFSQYGDLVTVATIADIVSLTGENRFLVKNGLMNLHNTERRGLVALMNVAGINLENPITAEQVGFMIAPRINAIGRIGNIDDAVELLLEQDEDEALKKAERVNNLNTDRKNIETKILVEMGEYFEKNPQALHRNVVIAVGRDWNAGVIGITASRVVDRYLKPTIIFTIMDDGEVRGSARSVEGFSIIDAISYCKDLLIKYGGHPMAAGLSLKEENLSAFIERLEEYCRINHPIMPYKSLIVDGDIDISDITLKNIELLSSLEPFGCDNPTAIPVIRNVRLQSAYSLGSTGSHTRLTLVDSKGATIDALLFSVRKAAIELLIGHNIDVAVNLGVNTFRGESKPQVKIVALAPSDFNADIKVIETQLFDRIMSGHEQSVVDKKYSFTREKMLAVFKYIRENAPYIAGEDFLYYALRDKLSYFDVLVSLEILKELNLIKYEIIDGVRGIVLVPVKEKADYREAPTYMLLASLSLV